MKIVCSKQTLHDALSGVSKAVSTKNSLPSVEGVLFDVEKDSVTLTGYNFELVITTKVDADIKETGSCVLNARLLSDFVRMGNGDTVSIEVAEDMNTHISSGSSAISFMAIPAADFPELPKPSTDSSLCINGLELRDMIEKTLYAVSQDEQKPVHTGTKFVIEEGSLLLVSVDGYRLALCRKPVINADEKSFVVPGRSLSEIKNLISDDENEVYINTARRYAVFYLAKYTVMTRLLEGDFLDYKRAIPDGYKTRVKVGVREMNAAVERASLIITDRLKSPVKFTFDEAGTQLSCVTSLGSVKDELSFTSEGESVTIGFNNRYILDALRNSGCDEVYFLMNGPVSPMKIIPVEGDDFLHLVLPVRIKVE